MNRLERSNYRSVINKVDDVNELAVNKMSFTIIAICFAVVALFGH